MMCLYMRYWIYLHVLQKCKLCVSCYTCKYIQFIVAKHIIMVDNMLYVITICNKSQYTMTKHIISINRHNSYQYIFPSIFLKWEFFISAWSTDAVYIQSTPINVFNPGLDYQNYLKFDKFRTWIKYIIIWQQKQKMSIFLVPLWMPRKKNTSISMKITNSNIIL